MEAARFRALHVTCFWVKAFHPIEDKDHTIQAAWLNTPILLPECPRPTKENGARITGACARHETPTEQSSTRQNNSRLDELASKVSALRGVTVDIYDNARNQEVIDSSVRYT